VNPVQDAAETDPLFVDAPNADFHLQATSVARHSVGGPYADLSATVPYDITGYPVSSTPDAGAYQFEITETGVIKRQRQPAFSMGFGF